MGIFVFAVVTGFLLAAPLGDPKVGDYLRRNRYGIVMQFLLGLLAAISVLVWIYLDPYQNARKYPDYVSKLIIILDQDVFRIFTGTIFGILLRYSNFLQHLKRRSVPRGAVGGWLNIAIPGVLLSFLFVIGLFGERFEHFLSNISEFSTPVLSAKLESFQSRKEDIAFEKIEELEISHSPIELLDHEEKILQDIEYYDLIGWDSNPIFREYQSNPRAVYDSTHWFFENVLKPFLHCVAVIYGEGRDLEPIRTQTRKLLRAMDAPALNSAVLFEPGKFKQIVEPFDSDRRDIGFDFVKRSRSELFNEVVIETAEIVSKMARFSQSKEACEEYTIPYIWEYGKRPIEQIAEGPYFHIIVGYIMLFNGNVEGAISRMEENRQKYKYDVNYNLMLATLLRFAKRDPLEFIAYFQNGLSSANRHLNKVKEQLDRIGSDDPNYGRLQELKDRYYWAQVVIKNNIAYYAARYDVWPEAARSYAEYISSEIESGKIDSRPLLRVALMDTVGYVKMTHSARRKFPQANEIELARHMLREANERLGSLEETIVHGKYGIDRSNAYRTSIMKRTIRKILSTHIELADRLLEDG